MPPPQNGQQGTAGHFITKRARSLNTSLRRLAVITGIPRSRLERYCRGGRLLADDVPMLCSALKCAPSDLIPALADERSAVERRLVIDFAKLTPDEQHGIADMIALLIRARRGL